jgi:hypothetical protein
MRTEKKSRLSAGFRAEDRARTGHPDLGKVVLYQMSYFRFYKELSKNSLHFLASHSHIRITKGRQK